MTSGGKALSPTIMDPESRRCVFIMFHITNIIAPIANHPNIGYMQLAASVSPLHRNTRDINYRSFPLLGAYAFIGNGRLKLETMQVNIVYFRDDHYLTV